MKSPLVRTLAALALSASLSACVSSVSYDLSSYVQESAPKVIDSRDVVHVKTKGVKGVRHAMYIGDEHLTPSADKLIGSKMKTYYPSERASDTELKQFELVLWFPRHSALAAGAAMAGANYSLGILTQSAMSQQEINNDGVIAKITLELPDGSAKNCSVFVEDYRAVGSLMGAMVSGDKLQATMNRAVDKCFAAMQ